MTIKEYNVMREHMPDALEAVTNTQVDPFSSDATVGAFLEYSRGIFDTSAGFVGQSIQSAKPGAVLADTDGDHWVRHATGAACVSGATGKMTNFDVATLGDVDGGFGPFRLVEAA